nr:hypothetical protein [Tanacetum cinerariifolium]
VIIANIDADEDVVLEDAKDVAVEKSADAKDNADIQGKKAESQAEIYKIDLEHAKKVLSMQEEESEPAELQKVVDVVTTAKIITEAVTAASDTTIAASTTITAADVPIPAATIAAAPTLTAAPSRRRNGTKEQMDEEDSRALKRLNESQEERAAKKQKLDKEVEELKRHLQIIPNEEDDVYTKATPLARKVPVVDYEIYNENNKPYYKIKRADARYTCSNLEESKKCSWSRKSQELEAVGILWCADNYIYNNTVDFTGRKEISTYKVHSGSDAK